MDAPILVPDDAENIAATARKLRAGELSAVELTRMALERIDRYNPALNAVVTVTAELALAAATRADRELRAGRDRGPLHGLPVGLKDVIDVRGVPTTMGSAYFQNHIPGKDATVVRRLRRAGAVIVGKLHTQEFAYGATGTDSLAGAARNPHDLNRVTGGSSSGPAAAVASGLCFVAVGTDTGGSVRIPSALCGVVGLKPTYGRISRTGVFPLSWTLDHVGPITRSVADNSAVLAALGSFDPSDPGSARRPPGSPAVRADSGVRGVRIGIPALYFEHLDPDVRHRLNTTLTMLEALGCLIRPVQVDGLQEVIAAQRTVLAVEAHAVHRDRFAVLPHSFQSTVFRRLRDGAEIPAWAYAESLEVRRQARRTFDNALADVDVLATPTVALPAPLIGQHEATTTGAAETVQSALTRLTGATNFSGHPSLTLPCGRSEDGLPIGIQLIGRYWDEAALYRVGAAIEQVTRDTADR